MDFLSRDWSQASLRVQRYLVSGFVILLTLPSSRCIGRAASNRFGEIGIIFAAAIAGFAARLSSAVLVASLVASRRLAESDALKLG